MKLFIFDIRQKVKKISFKNFLFFIFGDFWMKLSFERYDISAFSISLFFQKEKKISTIFKLNSKYEIFFKKKINFNWIYFFKWDDKMKISIWKKEGGILFFHFFFLKKTTPFLKRFLKTDLIDNQFQLFFQKIIFQKNNWLALFCHLSGWFIWPFESQEFFLE